MIGKNYASVVLVAVLDDSTGATPDQSRILENILINRWEYAEIHGILYLKYHKILIK